MATKHNSVVFPVPPPLAPETAAAATIARPAATAAATVAPAQTNQPLAQRSLQIASGIGAVAERYDVFLVDQYGVLHNGSEPYADAVACFSRLVNRPGGGTRVVLLSNTSKRAAGLREKLAAFGFDPHFLGAVTGGEVAWAYLDARKDQLRRCALMTADITESVARRQSNAQSVFFGLDLEVVDIDEAQFLLVEGSRQVCYGADPNQVLQTDFHSTGAVDDHIRGFLQRGRARDLLMLCTNPDLVAVLKDDRMVHMGGKIAKMYEEMGGRVEYFGKPRSETFELCLNLAGVTDRARAVHVGDSLHHDVQGAVNTGIDSIFIAGGVHAQELGMSSSVGERGDTSGTASTTTFFSGVGDGGGREESGASRPSGNESAGGMVHHERLRELCASAGVYPTYTVARFAW